MKWKVHTQTVKYIIVPICRAYKSASGNLIAEGCNAARHSVSLHLPQRSGHHKPYIHHICMYVCMHVCLYMRYDGASSLEWFFLQSGNRCAINKHVSIAAMGSDSIHLLHRSKRSEKCVPADEKRALSTENLESSVSAQPNRHLVSIYVQFPYRQRIIGHRHCIMHDLRTDGFV